MKQFEVTGAIALLCLSCATVCAQEHKADAGAMQAKVREAYFVHTDRLNLATIIPAPPAEDSAVTEAEIAELHRIQDSRTPEEVKAAQADDGEEDIFLYKTVFGPSFNAQTLPLTAALSAHVRNDEPIASNGLKDRFRRPRPYQVDTTLHPVCKVTDKHNAYPSGHTLSGYLLALTLVQMVPEKSAEILQRADGYAHNRLVCGVHTASDLEASRLMAYVIFGSLLEEPRFQQELGAARAETRRVLDMK